MSNVVNISIDERYGDILRRIEWVQEMISLCRPDDYEIRRRLKYELFDLQEAKSKLLSEQWVFHKR